MDWLQALQRLQQGRVGDSSQDKLYSMQGSDYPQGSSESFWQGPGYRDVEALPLGSLADPVSQLAFMFGPGILRALQGLGSQASPRLGSILANERGSSGSYRGSFLSRPGYGMTTPSTQHTVDELQQAILSNAPYWRNAQTKEPIDIQALANDLQSRSTKQLLAKQVQILNTPSTPEGVLNYLQDTGVTMPHIDHAVSSGYAIPGVEPNTYHLTPKIMIEQMLDTNASGSIYGFGSEVRK